MVTRVGYLNRDDARWVDSAGAALADASLEPFITRREVLDFVLNVGTDASGTYSAFTGWATGGPYTFRFFVDNDWTHYQEGTLAVAIPAGAVTSISITKSGLTEPLRTGKVAPINSAGESETFMYTSWTDDGTNYVFTVSATATYSYAQGDQINIIDPALVEVENADIDQSSIATGVLTITMSGGSQKFVEETDATTVGAELNNCRCELQILDASGNIVDRIGTTFRCLNLLQDDYSYAPGAPISNYYTKTESDARYATSADLSAHTGDATIHFTEASIDHTAIQNIGTNTHAQIDTHIANTSIHLPIGGSDTQVQYNNSGAFAGSSDLTFDSATGTLSTKYQQFDAAAANPSHSEGALFYDNTKNALSYYNDKSDVTVNLGQEVLIPVINKSGSLITNGAVVYPSGTDVATGLPTIALADASDKDKCRQIAMATHDIADSGTGYVTRLGAVGGVNTAGLSGTVYLSASTPGAITMTQPTLGAYVVTVGTIGVQDASSGSVVVDTYVPSLTVEVTDTNGFPPEQRTNTAMAFVNGTRTFTLSASAYPYHFYENGDKYDKDTSDSVVITDVEGLHVIYYSAGTLTALANPTNTQIDEIIRTKPLVAYIYWDATNGEYTYLGDERHGISMSPVTHTYLHFTRGAQYLSGLAINNLVTTGDGNTNSDAQFGVDSGALSDEDIPSFIAAESNTVGLPIYYLSGANADLRRDYETGYSVLTDVTAGVGATGRIVFNEWTGATWQLTAATTGNYVLCHVMSVNGYTGEDQTLAFIGNAQYSTISAARTGAETEISTILGAIPFQERVPVATIIFQTKDSFGNAVKARAQAFSATEEYVDWRTTELQAGAAATDHGNLANLAWLAAGHTGTAAEAEFAGFTAAGAATTYAEGDYVLLAGRSGDLLQIDDISEYTTDAGVTIESVNITDGVLSRAGELRLSATGSNLLSIYTNSSERVRVDAAGNLLVNTTTQTGSEKFNVNGSAYIHDIYVGRRASAAGVTLGDSAASSNTTGNQWTALGKSAGTSNSTGSDWVAVGYLAAGNSTGGNFTAVGYAAGYNNTSSNYVAIGRLAGYYQSGTSNNLTAAADSVYVGYNTKGTQSASNENVFGYGAEGNGSNTVTIGDSSITRNYFRGILGTAGNSLLVGTAKTPSSASDTGIQGQIAWDSSYLYVCTATDTWRRVAHATW